MADRRVVLNEEAAADGPDAEETLAIFDKVPYTYVNYAEVYWSNWDLRIAFGDDLPVGSPQPKVGLIMSLDYARLLHQSLGDALEQWSKLVQEHADHAADE